MLKGMRRSSLTGRRLGILTGGDLVEPRPAFDVLKTGTQGLDAFDQGTYIVAFMVDELKTSPYDWQEDVNVEDIGCNGDHTEGYVT